MKKNVLDRNYVYLELEDGILFVTFKEGLEMTLEIAKEIVEARVNFCGGKSYPGLANDMGLVSMDKYSRDYLSSDEGIKGVSAAALLTDSVFNTFIANFFLQINVIKPKVPTRIFTDKFKALKWLEQYKEI